MFKKFLPTLLLLAVPSLVLAAQNKPVLTVYTYDSFAADWGPGAAVKKAFEAECGCELKWVALPDAVSLLNRLRMEGSKSSADVILGLDNNLLEAAAQTGLFASTQVDTHNLTLPDGWKNSTFVPYDYGYFAFVYDKNKVKNPPTSLKQLVEGPEQWKVIYQDPRTSTPGLGLLLWMQKVYGDQTAEAWQKLAKKTVTVTKGWSEAYGLFLKGEADFVMSYTTSPAYHIAEEKKDNYAAANFSDGYYMQVEVAGRLKSSKHPQLAEQFLKFIVTPGFQDTIATGNWMYPVTNVKLPESFSGLVKPKTALEFSPQQVAEQRADWVNTWLTAVSR